jgi:3-oxoacyl-[acyl-carrier protein] reductase
MDLKIAGRTALVGGASAGLGLASARGLAAEGVRVALVARREPELQAAASRVAKDFGVQTLAVRADLQEKGECERAVEETVQKFGTLDILVANAGGPKAGHFSELSDEDWEAAFRLTFLSTSRLVRAAIPHMQKAGWGRIAVIGSLVTQEPRAELALSSGIRPGLVALVRLLARTHGKDGICINMVSPGYTRTERVIEVANAKREETGRGAMQALRAIAAEIPVGRLAEPEEIGAIVTFLCSEPAAFLTGVNLVCDGGQGRSV